MISATLGKEFCFGFGPGNESLVGHRAVADFAGRRNLVAVAAVEGKEVAAVPGTPSYRNETSNCTRP